MITGGNSKSVDDDAIWQAFTKFVKPLPGRDSSPVQHTVPHDLLDEPAVCEPRPPQETPFETRRRQSFPVLSPGEVRDIDHHRVERLQRGKLAIEGRCDLHGLTRDQARRELDQFLVRSQGRGNTCVLIITGQGKRGPLGERTSVIRSELPQWLNEPPNRQRILYFDWAHPRHGGKGACYVLLKRLRST